VRDRSIWATASRYAFWPDGRVKVQDGYMTDDVMAAEREFNKQNIEEFRRNGGKVGGQFEGFPLLILTSSGAKSGAERVNLIGYFDIDDKIYVVGSAAGREASPAWVFNLRAHPHVQVEIGSNPKRPVVARELPRDERDRIYRIIVERAPGFAEYEKRTDRVIPVFELVADR
jgi:deazaflavin-dependent oxidoreductase (nitroreductase family)